MQQLLTGGETMTICKVGCIAKRTAALRAIKGMEKKQGRKFATKPCDIEGCGGLHIVVLDETAKLAEIKRRTGQAKQT